MRTTFIPRVLLTLAIVVMSLSALTVTRAQGDVLLSDKFTDNSNGWQLSSTTSSKLTIKSGILAIDVSKPDVARWVTPKATFPNDIDVSVDTVTPEGGTKIDWNAAVILRADKRDSSTGFYQFEISGDGQWSFVTRTANGDEYKVQKSGKLDRFAPAAPHNLKVSAKGDSFTFSVNNKEVGTFEDSSVNSNDDDKYVGLLGGTLGKDAANITIQFKNLKVTTAAAQDLTDNTGSKGKVLLEETFPDDNPNKWSTNKSDTGVTELANNSLNITVSKEKWIRGSFPDTMFPADVDVTVDAQMTASVPKAEWLYGIGIRDYFVDKEEFYYLFEIGNDSTWYFERHNGSKGFETVVKATKIDLKNFHVDDATTMRVTAVGSHFEFYINGRKVGEADDDKLQPPDPKKTSIGLFAGTYENTTSLTVSFTNLVVTTP